MLQIYNSLTKKKEIFTTITPNQVKMYVCGMTVYDYCHIGHARVLVVFDMINRYLKSSGYQVNYIRNITDIDDKIINRANDNKEEIGALTERFISAMHEDALALGTTLPNEEPRATQYIAGMIAMIDSLIAKGHAYLSPTGDVLYETKTFADYGKLANQNLAELQVGQRVEVDSNKRSPLDFVLWKTAKPNEPYWESPWGNGRPGWHIECSVMAQQCLGNVFDIHGGGLDLKFPHHECEIAQSEPICGAKHVNYWMHNGFVQINSEKMAKSLGNFFTIREVLEKFSGETIRFFILGTHYRSPLNYSDAGLEEAKNGLNRLYTCLADIDNNMLEQIDIKVIRNNYPEFFNAMDDDFNTAKAISELFNLVKVINKTIDINEKSYLASCLLSLAAILGILQTPAKEYLQTNQFSLNNQVDAAYIEQQLELRQEARAKKDFKQSDEIRDNLNDLGVEIEDKAGKTTWRRKSN